MKKAISIGALVGALLVASIAVVAVGHPSSARAWSQQDCEQVNYQHPDCQQYTQPTAPSTPTETTPTESTPTETTPPTTTVPTESTPSPPPAYTPGPPTIGTGGSSGKVTTTSTTSFQPERQPSSTKGGQLPFTGYPAGIAALVGAVMLGAGALGIRRWAG